MPPIGGVLLVSQLPPVSILDLEMRAILIIFPFLVGCRSDAPPEGEGSYKAAARIVDELVAIKARGPSTPLPTGFYKFTFKDGSWCIATGIDSHNSPDGGTVGILTSSGDTAIFFMHVCGPGPTPFEADMQGDSMVAVMEQIRRTKTEYHRH